jgi:hypothetical protein
MADSSEPSSTQLRTGSQARALGRAAARRMARSRPERFRPEGVDLSALARDLRVEIEKGSDAGAKASWRLRSGPEREPQLWEPPDDIVRLPDRQKRRTTSRFFLAHELGHVMFRREVQNPEAWEIADEESYATAFASELLLGGVAGQSTKRGLREAADPASFLNLTNRIGVPPVVLLKRAVDEKWQVGPNVIWFDIRTVVNQITKRDRQLRVYRHLRDRSSWYMPRNRSVRGLFGSDEWLHSGMKKTAFTGTIDLSRPVGQPTRLVHEAVPVEVQAIRLRPAAASGPGIGLEVLARAALCLGAA